MSEGLEEFEEAEVQPFSQEALEHAVLFAVVNKALLTTAMIDALSGCLPTMDNEDLDLNYLVKSQMRSAVSLKDSFFNRNGDIKENASSKDAKDALSACQQIIGVLIKQQEQLDRSARLLKMENVFLACVQDMPEEYKVKFLDQLAKQLEE